jgi:hypothetical protein
MPHLKNAVITAMHGNLKCDRQRVKLLLNVVTTGIVALVLGNKFL